MIGPVSASIAMAAISLAPRSAAGTPGCLAEPGAIAAAFEESWNRHDMEEFASLFWEDASFVARGGQLSIGP